MQMITSNKYQKWNKSLILVLTDTSDYSKGREERKLIENFLLLLKIESINSLWIH